MITFCFSVNSYFPKLFLFFFVFVFSLVFWFLFVVARWMICALFHRVASVIVTVGCGSGVNLCSAISKSCSTGICSARPAKPIATSTTARFWRRRSACSKRAAISRTESSMIVFSVKDCVLSNRVLSDFSTTACNTSSGVWPSLSQTNRVPRDKRNVVNFKSSRAAAMCNKFRPFLFFNFFFLKISFGLLIFKWMCNVICSTHEKQTKNCDNHHQTRNRNPK